MCADEQRQNRAEAKKVLITGRKMGQMQKNKRQKNPDKVVLEKHHERVIAELIPGTCDQRKFLVSSVRNSRKKNVMSKSRSRLAEMRNTPKNAVA